MVTLVTGANGFVGSALCRRLIREGVPVRVAVRSAGMQQIDTVAVGNISGKTDWGTALKEVQCVVHLAARVHVMTERSPDPWAEFRRINVEGTVSLARQAACAGVKRFVFLSSIKVNGEATQLGKPFTSVDVPFPADPYGISKLEAEEAIREIADRTGMEVVIIRPPLVYGPGVKANFEMLIRWLVRGVPLPFGAITHNRRSFVALDNLVDLIVACLHHPAAANQIFLVSDGEDLSTVDLLRRLGEALGNPAHLFYFPPLLLKLLAVLFNRDSIYQRLCGSLQVDMSNTRQLLNWAPPLSVDAGLRLTAQGFQR